MDTSQPKSFVAAMKDYFGFQPGQTFGGFIAEVRALNDADKAYFTAELTRVGYTVTAS